MSDVTFSAAELQQLKQKLKPAPEARPCAVVARAPPRDVYGRLAAPAAPEAHPCAVVAHAPPRFDPVAQRAELLAHLDAEGYAVVADVFDGDHAALARARALQWDFLEGLPGARARRDDPATWTDAAGWLPDPGNGIVNGFGFGQSAAQWALRLRPRVRRAFEAVWGTADLLVSFDGGNMVRPARAGAPWAPTRGGWWHVDQNALRAGQRGRCCVQGLVTLTDANAATGGLCVVPRSHRDFAALCARAPLARAKGAFVPVDARDPLLARGGVLVCARAGDLILWDSRTAHCNTPALAPAEEAEEEEEEGRAKRDPAVSLQRQVGYVCMTPARWATAETLARRRDAFVRGESTSHWPHEFVVAGVGLPDAPDNDPDAISPEQRRLVGYDRPAPGCAVM